MAFDPLATPGISLEWQGAPERWKDASTLGACLASYVFDNQLPLAGRLCGTRGAQDLRFQRNLQIRSLPWRALVEHVLSQGSRPGVPALRTPAELGDYLQAWSAGSAWVTATLKWRYAQAATQRGDLRVPSLCAFEHVNNNISRQNS